MSRNIRNCQQCRQSLLYLSFSFHFSLCCVSTSPDRELLSAGFEDGSSKVWKLVPGTFPSVDNVDSPSYIYLSADYLETYEDEEEDLNKRYMKKIDSFMFPRGLCPSLHYVNVNLMR